MKRVFRRIASRAGESIGETLAAILIMAFAFVMLSGAVVAAARVTERVKNEKEVFSADAPDAPAPACSEAEVTVHMGGPENVPDQTFTVSLHKVNGYYYYDEATPAP